MTRAAIVVTAALLCLSNGSPAQTAPPYAESPVHYFCYSGGAVCPDGSAPIGDLIQASDGNLYGVTETGGANGRGSVFAMSPSGTFVTLYSFCSVANCTDGEQPEAGLTEGLDGNLYGTTRLGGASGAGTVFRLSSNHTLSVLYSFCSQSNCADGQWPRAGLVEDSAGNFYGTAQYGGPNGAGTMFQISSALQFRVIYSFCSSALCTDGALPEGTLVQASNGSLYGTTAGKNSGGTVFQFAPTGLLTTLHSFCAQANCPDGRTPTGRLVQLANGTLYGTTQYGGQHYSAGTVFAISQAGQFTSLYSFCRYSNCTDGANPLTNLFPATDGFLYGTVENGGTGGDGALFRISTAGALTTLYSFCNSGNCYDGAYPEAGALQGSDGNIYTSTLGGGIQQLAGVVTVLRFTSPVPAPINIQAPVELALGQIGTIAWTTSNAFSQTLQDCEAFVNGQPYAAIPSSGSTPFSSPYPGILHLAITCGGMESGLATITINSSSPEKLPGHH